MNLPFSDIFLTTPEQPASSHTHLRVGLIVDDFIINGYTHDLLQWCRDEKSICVDAVIVQNQVSNKNGILSRFLVLMQNRSFLFIFNKIMSSFIIYIELFIFKIIVRHFANYHKYSVYFNSVDISNYPLKFIPVDITKSKSGYHYFYNSISIDEIKKLNIDVLVRCGSGILSGEILNCTKYGVLSFHHGDNHLNRGGPAGYWEVFKKQVRTGFVIQQLTEVLDGGNILFRGYFLTKPFYIENQASLLGKSNIYMKKILLELSNNKCLPSKEESLPYSESLYRSPTAYHQLIYVSYVIEYIFSKIMRRLLRKKYKWGVAFANKDWKDVIFYKGIKFHINKGSFIADPYLFIYKNDTYCFVEEFLFSKNKGVISVYKINSNEAEYLGIVLEQEFHLSFPFIFTYETKTFMIPETSQNSTVSLYECVRFPYEWKFVKHIFKNIQAVDTIIFEKNELWWLITTIDPSGYSDMSSELFVFYSSNPLSDNWHAHKQNPIVIDPLRGRNGGIVFDDNNNVFRIAQSYAFNLYGYSSKIYQIDLLNEDYYNEVEKAQILPNYFPNIFGTHHLNSKSNITVFDYLMK